MLSSALISGLSQAGTMVVAGVLALIAASTLGSTAGTDGFFASFAVYSTIVSFIQSARVTIVARLLEGQERFDVFDAYLGAGVILFAIASLAFGALGAPLAHLLTSNARAYHFAHESLLILWPAVGLQIFAALGAAMLGGLDDFAGAGLPFVAGGVVAVGSFLVLRPGSGTTALPMALLISSMAAAAAVLWSLWRHDWRPDFGIVSRPREAVRALRTLSLASMSFVIAQIGYIVTVSIGARLGHGVVTEFTYAFMAASLLQALFVSAVPLVLAAPLARTWDHRDETLIPHHRVVLQAGLLLTIPAVAAVLLVGTNVVGVLLGKFSHQQVRLVVTLMLILSANVIWGLIQAVPYAAVVAVGRYRAVAWSTAIVVAIQIGVSLIGDAVHNVYVLVAADPISSAVGVVTIFLIVSRRYPAFATPQLARIIIRLSLAAGVAFGIPWGVLRLAGVPAAGAIGLVVGLAAFGVMIATRLPEDREVAVRLLAILPIKRLGH
jgi:peptidoglycan biosynthesis protein MviN/MurJ (putative lipid II flippase)